MHKKGKDKTVLHVKQVNSVLDTVELLIGVVLCLLQNLNIQWFIFEKKNMCFFRYDLDSLFLNKAST